MDSKDADMIEMDYALCVRRLSHFAEKSWHLLEPGRLFIPGWHIDAIAEHLQAVIDGQLRNLVINIPPRHMKSLLVSVLFPAWGWTRRPNLRWLFASYAESLSVRDSVKCRRVIQSDWYQKRFGHIYQLTGDQNQKQKYENNRTGHRLATSVNGAGTGEGGDIIVIDDPHKVSESESDTVRQSVLDWWDGEMSTRGNDPKKVAKIIVMQRVHEKDLSGHILAKESGFEHLRLPAEYEPKHKSITSIGWQDPRTEDGELLWRERFGMVEIESLKKDMGSQKAAGQLQQRPAPAEGNIIKRHWWKFYTKLPTRFDKIGISADLTFKDGKKNDFVVFHAWGKLGADKYLLDELRDKMSFTVQLAAFKRFCEKWPAAQSKWIEDAANCAALIDVLRSSIPGLIAVPSRSSKVARVEAVSPQIQSGNILLPHPELCPWIEDYIEEHTVFPNGSHDDRVDATSLGISQLSGGIVYDWKPVSLTGQSKWLR